MVEPIRILSDIHVGHPGSVIDDVNQLRPLFRGAGTVIFNGDTVEMRFVSEREKGRCDLENVIAVCQAESAQPIFVNGNHDPVISSASHLDLADGAVLVTHGDFLFHNISPWSKDARIIRDAHDKALAELGADALEDFEKRLSAQKRAALAIELHDSNLPRGPLARVMTFVREAWPPWRPLQIVKVWLQTPGKAAALARVFRPHARFVLIGHTHFGGLWKVGPRVIINTGSFIPIVGRRLVDLEGDTLTVKKIARDRSGDFVVGDVIERFPVSKLEDGEEG